MAKLYPIPPSHHHDEVYLKKGEGGVTDHGLLTGLDDHDHPQYLLTTGKAADSDKVDGYHASKTPTASTVPVSGTDKKLDNGWLKASATPTADLIPIAGADNKLDAGWIPEVGVWKAHTVAWTATTNPAIGNGTIVARYVLFGTICILTVGIVAGSTTTFGTGNWKFSLPKACKNTTGINFYGVAHLRKAGTANYERICQIAPSLDANNVLFFNDPTPGSNSLSLNSTTPFSWGDGDSLGFQIQYEFVP